MGARVQLIKRLIEESNKVVDGWYLRKKLMSSLGLPVQKIDVCLIGKKTLREGSDSQLNTKTRDGFDAVTVKRIGCSRLTSLTKSFMFIEKGKRRRASSSMSELTSSRINSPSLWSRRKMSVGLLVPLCPLTTSSCWS
ncbi:hypothetical protein M9H77_12722 [Catharanthus roseus]|uniref:Uncharacterized protein n=1 Tax=Catharanthus roseus TaxID=4058 RepID=A0ACC0BIC4_CATRO|nr:hypothetical protein M9H77_12722 [Catharanthus roseus]